MKTILAAVFIGLFANAAGAQAPESPAPARYKEVCRENKEKKKVCKKIRVHKKLDGKPVPKS